jgi:hypothetical protein
MRAGRLDSGMNLQGAFCPLLNASMETPQHHSRYSIDSAVNDKYGTSLFNPERDEMYHEEAQSQARTFPMTKPIS